MPSLKFNSLLQAMTYLHLRCIHDSMSTYSCPVMDSEWIHAVDAVDEYYHSTHSCLSET